MAKYKVNYEALEDVDAGVLIDAVCRYCNGTDYSIDAKIVLAILGIEKTSEQVEHERNLENKKLREENAALNAKLYEGQKELDPVCGDTNGIL